MSASGSKIGKAQIEEMFSGLPPKADLGSALAPVAPRPSINNTRWTSWIQRRSRPHANEESE
jgi:hypothetical protein